ncbi:hypothetical protein GIY11_02045 [Aerococcaceae bacterium DSM 109653]|uniref:Uncharacterized protein n=1 Tax=Fundicoccus ignavus TaxID=2664442 RepID=A0A844BFS3_9LACT|nr:hypothetical protein [Fundicoccus ignavus]MRI80810.1 hypothetical protein [Fundicoccus ignavus]
MKYALTITDKNRIIDLYADYIKYILIDFEEFFAELEGIYLGHNYYPLYQISCNILLNWQEEASNNAKSIIDKWKDSDASIENVLWSIEGSEDMSLDTFILAGELQTELVRSTMSLFQFEYDLSHISNSISMEKDIAQIFSDFKDKTNQLKRKIESNYEDITNIISDATPDNNIYQFLRYFVDIIFNLLRKHINRIYNYIDMSEHDLINHLTKVQFSGQSINKALRESINNYELGQLNTLFSHSDFHTIPTEFNALMNKSKTEGSSIGHKKKIILKRNGSIHSSHYYHFVKKDGKDVLIFEHIDGNSAVIWSSADWDDVEKVIPNARLIPSYFLQNGNQVKIDDIYKFPELNDIIINGTNFSHHRCRFKIIEGKKSIVFKYIHGKSAVNWNPGDWELVAKQIPDVISLPAYFEINNQIQKIPDQYKFPELNDIIINGTNFSHHRCRFKIIEGKKSIVFKYIHGKSAVNWNPGDWELVAKQIPDVISLPAYFEINNQIQKIPDQYKFPELNDIIINGTNFSHHRCRFKIIEGKKSIVFKYIHGKSAVNWNPGDWELVAKQMPDVISLPAYFEINNQIHKIPEAYKKPDSIGYTKLD